MILHDSPPPRITGTRPRGARASLAQRARPLIELLSTAAREGDYVMWDLP